MADSIVPSRRERAVVFAIALLGAMAALALYGWRVELSGDQNPQIVAARSLVAEGRLLVPPHPTQAPALIQPEVDARETLFWFPPGYSLLLTGIHAATNISLAGCAAAIFWANLLAGNFVWSLWARRVGFTFWQVALVILFLSTLSRPSTTTDQFVTTLVGALFLIDSYGAARPAMRIVAVSVLLCAAISLRWAATFVALAWALCAVLAPPRRGWTARLMNVVPAAVALIFYLGLSAAVAPAAGLYAGGGNGPPTQWTLIWKALWFAGSGGWSPLGLPLRAVHALLVLFVVPAAVFVAWRKRKLPRWLAGLVALQLLSIVFLAWVQLKYASMYDPETPAFATARFYALARPASVLALGLGGAWAVGRLGNWAAPAWRAWLPVSLYLVAAGTVWVRENRLQLSQLPVSHDGFRRKAELNEIAAHLARWNPDSVIARDGYLELCTLVDSRRLHPPGQTLQLNRHARIAIVSLRSGAPLPWELVPAESAQRVDRLETATFRLTCYLLMPGSYSLVPGRP